MDSPGEDNEEQQHFIKVVEALLCLPYSCILKNEKLLSFYSKKMNSDQRKRTPYIIPKYKKVAIGARINSHFLENMLKDHQNIFVNQKMQSGVNSLPIMMKRVSGLYLDKARSTLLQFYREWSKEGEAEREQCFTPILNALNTRYPDEKSRSGIKVVTPGCGLGRLTFDIAYHGYFSQGNEGSYFMLLGSHFILNQINSPLEHTLCPFLSQTCNLLHHDDQYKPIKVPDVCPKMLLQNQENKQFSMVAGDFLHCYEEDTATWDCVATCFFIDTAPNIIEYVETIHTMLKPKGIWINNGPLLYHYADMDQEESIELSWAELKTLIVSFGFCLEEEKFLQCPYINNPSSMMHLTYTSVFFVARKP